MNNSGAPPFWLKFGVVDHTPAACGERAAALPMRKSRKSAEAPCPTCGSTKGQSTIEDWSWAVCAGCHATAPGKAPIAAAHERPSLKYDRRNPPKPAAPKPWITPWLTKKEAEAMLADARRGDQPIGEVEAFLASQAS